MRDQELERWRSAVRVRAINEGRDLPSDVVDELAGHLADCYAEAIRRGGSEAEARRIAERQLAAASFGGLAARRRVRAPLGWRDALPSVVQDVRYAIRQLRRSPGFTATALVTLAIGIGANTAVFTLVHAVLLKALPVAHAGELYRFGDEYRCCTEDGLQDNWRMFPYPFYVEIRDNMPAFDELAAMETLRPNLSLRRGSGSGTAEPFAGEFVSGNYFTTLGVTAWAGRLIAPADDRRGAGPIAVASYRAWQKYGFDASLVGEPVTINGISVTVVGAAPPAFFGDRLDSHPSDFWMPLALEPAFMRESSLLESPSAGWLTCSVDCTPARTPRRSRGG